MSSKQGSPSFPAEKISGTHRLAALLMIVLIGAACGLHYLSSEKQKNLTRVTAAAQRQLALTQRMALTVAQYQSTRDERNLSMLKEAASSALTLHDTLSPLLLSASSAPSLQLIHSFIDKAFIFAVSPTSEESQNVAAFFISQAQFDIPDAWNKDFGLYAAAAQKDADLLSMASLGAGGLALLLLLYSAFVLVPPALKEIIRQREELEHLAATDALTGTYNRVMLFKVAAMLISAARRHKSELTALAVDIDGFKKINETHGRAAGDLAIRTVCATLDKVLRNSDAMGRLGGGEFGIFLPSTDEYRASLVAEKLRAAVEETPFAVKESTVLLRVSIGIAELQEHHKTPDDMLRTAEAALRHAKDNGRNKVAVYSAVKAAAAAAASAG